MTSTGEYADVVEMFCRLNDLAPKSHAYCRQRDLIVQRCLSLADHIALRYRGRGECLEDLIQVARVGLVKAVNRFDIDNSAGFLPFAIVTITGELRHHFREHGWAVKVPRRIKDLHPQMAKAIQDLLRQLNRSPNASEIAEYLGVDRELIVDALVARSNYSVLSIDVPRPGDDESSLVEKLGASDLRLERVLDVQTVRPLLAALPERERTVIKLRFFDEMAQTEIAERIGCSQMHVSRLLAQALRTLRKGARQSDLAAAG